MRNVIKINAPSFLKILKNFDRFDLRDLDGPVVMLLRMQKKLVQSQPRTGDFSQFSFRYDINFSL